MSRRKMLVMNVEIGLSGVFGTFDHNQKQKQKMNYFMLETECFILLKGILNVFRYQRMSKEVRNHVYLNG